MKTLKKLTALLLVAVLLFSFAGCHKKGETSLQVGDVKFTSGVYMLALITADSEARGKVDEAKQSETADESADATVQATTDYYAETIDEKNFETWVRDRAVEILRNYAGYITKCNELGITVSEDELSQAKQYADYYWDSYYKQMFEANGVGKESYVTFTQYACYENAYFDYLYGEGGPEEISADELKTSFNENYKGVHVIEIQTEDEDAVTSAKEKLEGYKKRIEKGEDFKKIYLEHNNQTEDDIQTTEDGPKDALVSLVGSADTDYSVDYFDELSSLKFGEMIIHEEESKVTLIQLVDISGDSYYFDQTADTIRRDLKLEEFEDNMTEFASTLEVTEHKYSMNQFNIKKIDYGNNQ